MNFIFEIAVNALEAFLILEFLVRYFGFKVQVPLRYIGFCIAWLISTISISFFSWNDIFEINSSLLQILINIIFCVLLLKGDTGTQIFLSAFSMVGIALIGNFTTYIVTYISDKEFIYIFTEFSSIRLTAIILSKILFFQITRLILLIKEQGRLSTQEIVTLVISPIISICTISILTHVTFSFPDAQQYIFFAVCLVILLNLSTYYLFIHLSRNSRLKHNYELLTLQYDCIKQNAADIQNMYENIRATRHDMKNHLLCILNLLRDQPDCNQPARDYIQKLLNQQTISQRKIIFSGNDALDAILNTKQITAFQYGINFDTVIADSLHFMSAEDICVLFGNLLDNAIAAAEQSEEKQINLKIQPQDTYVSIVLSNSIKGHVLLENPELKTTRLQKDGHGYGIKNIRKVVHQYYGLVRFYESEGQFVSDILLLTVPIVD